MTYADLPPAASWAHREAREGFEVLTTSAVDDGLVLRGHTTALEAGDAWSLGYEVQVDTAWRTRSARVTALRADGEATLLLERTNGGWTVDGTPRPDLAGCEDVDLESSAVTNTLPVHRLDTPVGVTVAAPAAYVRADLTVERLEQTYARLDAAGRSYAYGCPRFGVACTITSDAHGLVVDYPGLAVRRS